MEMEGKREKRVEVEVLASSSASSNRCPSLFHRFSFSPSLYLLRHVAAGVEEQGARPLRDRLGRGRRRRRGELPQASEELLLRVCRRWHRKKKKPCPRLFSHALPPKSFSSTPFDSERVGRVNHTCRRDWSARGGATQAEAHSLSLYLSRERDKKIKKNEGDDQGP